MEVDKPIEIHINLFPRLEKVGHFIAGLFTQLHHEGYSEHFQEHPLDTPPQPVTTIDWPNQNRWDSEGCYLEREV